MFELFNSNTVCFILSGCCCKSCITEPRARARHFKVPALGLRLMTSRNAANFANLSVLKYWLTMNYVLHYFT